MRRATWVMATILAGILFVPAQAWAQAPMLLNYQGNLTDPGGTPKNGTFTMQFSVYDAETGGNQLPTAAPWGEAQSVTVTNGVFNVLLGSVTALPTDLFSGGPSDSAGPLRYLQVVVAGETLSPRRRVVSAAYAIQYGQAPAGGVFGDGSDGDAVLDGSAVTWASGTAPYFLLRDAYLNSLSVPTGAVLRTNGYRLFVSGTLSNSGEISADGGFGYEGSSTGNGQGGFAGSRAHYEGTLPESPPGQAGGTGGMSAAGLSCPAGSPGSQGVAGAGRSKSLGVAGATGGAGGSGGANGMFSGGAGASGGGAGGLTGSAINLPRTSIAAYNLFDTLPSFQLLQSSAGSGSGGGGGGGASWNFGGGGCNPGGRGGGGGGSGAPGGTVVLFARLIDHNGLISARGGMGGRGGDGQNANAVPGPGESGGGGGGGGGAGGGGGVIILVYGEMTGSGSTNVDGGTGGAAGSGGFGVNSGVAGLAGDDGVAGSIFTVSAP